MKRIDNRYDNTIGFSKSFAEMEMKFELMGIKKKDIAHIIICRIMSIFKMLSVKMAIIKQLNYIKNVIQPGFNYLHTIKDQDVISKYIVSKRVFSDVLKCLFDDEHSVESNAYQFFLDFIRLVHHFDKDFIKSFHDKEGDNLLTLFCRLKRFKQQPRCYIPKYGSYFDASDYIMGSNLEELFSILIKKMGCNPREKNNSGLSLEDFIHDKDLRFELGIDKVKN
jgi:hypothetical protein